MALGPNRQVFQTTIDYAMSEVAERGGVVSFSATAGEVRYDPDGSGAKPVGLLLTDVEDLNFDKHPQYLQRAVSDVGSVVAIANKGVFDTDMVVTGATPSQGDPAYLHPGGKVSTVKLDDGLGNVSPRVGTFRSSLDANGFVRLLVDL